MDPRTIKTRERFKPPPTIQNTTLAQRKFMKFNPTSVFRQATELVRVGGMIKISYHRTLKKIKFSLYHTKAIISQDEIKIFSYFVEVDGHIAIRFKTNSCSVQKMLYITKHLSSKQQ